jgi:hypothetical protein
LARWVGSDSKQRLPHGAVARLLARAQIDRVVVEVA